MEFLQGNSFQCLKKIKNLFSVWPVYLDGELKIINYIASSVRNHSAVTDETNASRGGTRPACLNSSRCSSISGGGNSSSSSNSSSSGCSSHTISKLSVRVESVQLLLRHIAPVPLLCLSRFSTLMTTPSAEARRTPKNEMTPKPPRRTRLTSVQSSVPAESPPQFSRQMMPRY